MSTEMAADQCTKATSKAVEAVSEFLEKYPDVKVIITQWVDVCGVLRSRMTSSQKFLDVVASGGSFNQSVLDMLLQTTAALHPDLFGHFCDERGRIIPDISSLRIAPNDASAIGNVAMVMGEADLYNMDPRTNLRRMVNEAETHQNLRFLVGFELEMCFLQPDTTDLAAVGPCVAGVGISSATHRSALWPVLNEAIASLAEAGILAEQVIKEYGKSQWEICLPPLPPVEAVDTYIYAMEVVKNIAHKHNIVATFYPTPYVGNSNKQKSGQHIHFSATMGGNDGRDNDTSSWNPDEVLAGILSHIPSLMAIGLSQVDSYERVGEANLCTGGLLGWGDHHRDMPVRRIHRNHWEIRFHDSTSNPYAMVAGIIAAALDRKPLTIGNATKFTPMISKEEREELGLIKALPHSLKAALDELEADRQWAEAALGKEYIRWFLTLKRAEMEAVTGMEVNERRKLMISYF